MVLAGGELTITPQVQRLATEASLVIAADSGLRHARGLGLTPDLIVGDFDSVAADDLDAFPTVPRQVHPPDKDQLDLELAIDEARARGVRQLAILGALGGRFDQSLAALLIAARLCRQDFELSLHGGGADAVVLCDGRSERLDVAPGTVFSLLSLEGAATVSVTGGRYPLEQAELPFGLGQGISNVAAEDPCVTAHRGLVAVIVERNLHG